MDKHLASQFALFCSISFIVFNLRDYFVEPIILFLMVGAIPGTTFSLPYWLMLIIHSAAALVVILAAGNFYAKEMARAKTFLSHKNRLPSRRFQQI